MSVNMIRAVRAGSPWQQGLALKAAARRLGRLGRQATDLSLSPLANVYCSSVDSNVRTVFIIGAPRTGSTLFYQSMVYTRRFAYISNELAHFPHSLGLVAALRRADRWPVSPDFMSRYGETAGAAGPSEAGQFWDLVFPYREHHTVDPEAWPLKNRLFAVRHISKLVGLFGAPFLCKNIWHSVRLEALSEAFPNSVFLVMRRDRLMAAQSILAMQRARAAQSQGFWSIRPRELLGKEKLSLAEQVAWQIVHTEEAIERARHRLGKSRFLDVHYEEFCRAPDTLLDQVAEFLSYHGMQVERRARIDAQFESNQKCFLESHIRAEIEPILMLAAQQHDTSSLAVPRA